MNCRPSFSLALAAALVAAGCAGAPALGKETVIRKAPAPQDNRPFWKRLALSIRPDIKLDNLNYLGLKGGAKF